ncbi:peptidoglycan DD-metalloendopeptidase family protein [Microbacteriaceae bacterium 4G12]
MKNRRVEEIRKRIEKRKAEQDKQDYAAAELVSLEEQANSFVFEETTDDVPPLFRKEVLLFKVLCSICLVVGTAILFKNPNPAFVEGRTVVKKVMEQELQFASISRWYEQQFGKPLTLLPAAEKKAVVQKDYAVPASGKVLQSFQANGQGVFVQTNVNAQVDAVNEGVAIYVGKKGELGNTIIIQHADGTESWYGHLAALSVGLYAEVKKQQKIGVVANEQDGKTGTFYFALKKNEKFIDPIQVISFE